MARFVRVLEVINGEEEERYINNDFIKSITPTGGEVPPCLIVFKDGLNMIVNTPLNIIINGK